MELKKVTFEETIPCGRCITTQYFDAANVKVRQDIQIIVEKPPTLLGETGEVD